MTWTLVTGGSRRVGADICRKLAARGHNVVIHYNTSKSAAEELAEECQKLNVKADVIQGDFSTRDSTSNFIREYLEKFTETKYIVHNVGNYRVEGPLSTDIEKFEELMQTNFFAPVQITKLLLPSVIEFKGRIIALGVTGLNSQRADTYSTAFTITKMGLLTYVKSLAEQLASAGVTVNMVSPGQLDNSIDMPEDITTFPMRRPGRVDEVTRVIEFLFEPESSYITGQNIEVAGALRL